MRLPNVRSCSVGPLECKFMALLKITHFWCISLVHFFLYNFLDYTVTLAPYMHGYDTVQIDGG